MLKDIDIYVCVCVYKLILNIKVAIVQHIFKILRLLKYNIYLCMNWFIYVKKGKDWNIRLSI